MQLVAALSIGIAAVHAAIQFEIASGTCPGVGLLNDCDNSDVGGLCASTPDLPDQEWCCVPGEAACGRWAQTCTGAGGAAGPSQLLCSLPDGSRTWCCNSQYETCRNLPNVFNLCDTNFANPYNDTSTQEALSIKAAYFATVSSSRPTNTLTVAVTASSSVTTTETSTSAAAGNSAASATASDFPQTPTPNDGGSSGIKGGAIAGIAIGVVAIVALLVLGAFCFGKHKKRKQEQVAAYPHRYEPTAQESYGQQTWDPKYGRHEMSDANGRHEMPAPHGLVRSPVEVP